MLCLFLAPQHDFELHLLDQCLNVALLKQERKSQTNGQVHLLRASVGPEFSYRACDVLWFLMEKLIVANLLKKVPGFHSVRRYIIQFPRTRKRSA
jgi:hypothetical protein